VTIDEKEERLVKRKEKENVLRRPSLFWLLLRRLRCPLAIHRLGPLGLGGLGCHLLAFHWLEVLELGGGLLLDRSAHDTAQWLGLGLLGLWLLGCDRRGGWLLRLRLLKG
jgi:hypothetical protein